MTRRNPSAQWVLPNVTSPETSTCYIVPVPDDPMHKAAFLGAIADLGSAYKWANDPDHRARDVAQVWREIADNLAGCEPMIQFRQYDNCTLQVSFDAGISWVTVFNAYACAVGAARDEIQTQVDGGQISGGSQQPGIGSGEPLQCYNYSITLQANNQWLAPVTLGSGDTITTSLLSGAWNDGIVLHYWRCANGTTYALGLCGGSTDLDAGDPLPESPHMMLVGNLPDDIVTPYFEMYNTTYTVPDGIAEGQLFLQANDGNLPDNFGSINLHVQICKGGFCYHFDFTESDGGFTAIYGSWSDGVGFVSEDVSSGEIKTRQARLMREYTSTEFTSVEVFYTYVKGGFDASVDAVLIDPGTDAVHINESTMIDGEHSQLWDSEGVSDALDTLVASSFNTSDAGFSGLATITGITFRGRGAVSPFGESNC